MILTNCQNLFLSLWKLYRVFDNRIFDLFALIGGCSVKLFEVFEVFAMFADLFAPN